MKFSSLPWFYGNLQKQFCLHKFSANSLDKQIEHLHDLQNYLLYVYMLNFHTHTMYGKYCNPDKKSDYRNIDRFLEFEGYLNPFLIFFKATPHVCMHVYYILLTFLYLQYSFLAVFWYVAMYVLYVCKWTRYNLIYASDWPPIWWIHYRPL